MTAASALSRGLIEATEPPEYRGIARDGVRMLVTDLGARTHAHAHFYDLPALLRRGDLLVVNDSATLPAALVAQRNDGTMLRLHISTKVDQRLWMVEPRGFVTAGETLRLPANARAVMLSPAVMLSAVEAPDATTSRQRLWYAAFALPTSMEAYLQRYGTPITYSYVNRAFPLSEYQTLFAREPGSSEMPSAARPFTARVLVALRDRGIEIAAVTLHCGVASFERPERPGIERFNVSHETAERVNAARHQGRRVIAVGTTVVRALESAVTEHGVIGSQGWTDIYINEAHRLDAVDGLLSGFHDQNATHVAMLQAFASADVLQEAYAQAATHGYFYHEFGDVHLIARLAPER
ncbi:MAG TPA: S-adenosylmethionine:tRNA ribosyltransferase-isomerase [Candidatus Cybelea sp.]|nr:S-adenosylmethionine:tRNA ribosyltransferase-isomerase [Candidatus Cybelea sp.]